MAEISVDATSEGNWLVVTEGDVPVLGAYLEPRAALGKPFTIIWNGDLQGLPLVEFCRASVDKFEAFHGAPKLSGRVFSSGRSMRFEGPDWLEAARVNSPVFIRFECFSLNDDNDGFILWARRNGRQQDGSEENLGVQLLPARLFSLEQQLVSLITATQIRRLAAFDVRTALRQLESYLHPRSTPQAMSTAG